MSVRGICAVRRRPTRRAPAGLAAALVAVLAAAVVGLSGVPTQAAAPAAPQPPTQVRVPPLAFDEKSITLAWEKPDHHAGIVDYHVYQGGHFLGAASQQAGSPAKPFIDAFQADPANAAQVRVVMNTYTATGLRPDTRYTFTVRSVDAAGHESRDSARVTQSTTPVPRVFNVVDYGAVGDGKTLNTKAIQAAIDATTPGGKVLVPAGTFATGAIWLKSDMTLEVAAGATLLGSDNADDYPYGFRLYDYSNDPRFYSLINAHTYDYGSLENIRIVGAGTIDGNGWKQGPPDADGFPVSLPSSINTVSQNGILAKAQTQRAAALGSASPYGTRSNLITLRGVRNAYLGGFTAVNPSQHDLVTIRSDNVTVDGVKMLTYDVNNGDGIDFTNGDGLTVINCVFDTGDDDMNFAAGLGAAAAADPPDRHAWISNNYFHRGHGAVVEGSHTGAWIEDIVAEDNVINGTDTALRMKTDPNNGGGSRRVLFRDNAVKNVGKQAFIFTSAYAAANAAIVVEPAPQKAAFYDVRVEHVTVDGTGAESINVLGVPAAYHHDLHFDDVRFLRALPTSIQYLADSTFRDVVFDSTPNPWVIAHSTGLSFAGTTTRTAVTADASGRPTWPRGAAVSAVPGDSSVRLTWTPATDNTAVAGYTVFDGGTALATAGGDASTALVTGLSPALTYRLRIVAADATGNATPGPSVTVTTTGTRDTVPPSPPAGAAVSVVPGGIGTTWAPLRWPAATDNYGVSAYAIIVNGTQVAELPAGAGTPVGYTVGGLRPATAYVFGVVAIDAAGNRTAYAPSPTVTTLPPYDRAVPTWPAHARITAGRVGPTSVTLTWTPATDDQKVAGYRLYRDGVPIGGSVPFTPANDACTTTSTGYTVTGLRPGTRYEFTVQAGDTAQRWTGSGPSNSVRTPAG